MSRYEQSSVGAPSLGMPCTTMLNVEMWHKSEADRYAVSTSRVQKQWREACRIKARLHSKNTVNHSSVENFQKRAALSAGPKVKLNGPEPLIV
jgi:hypothetical protein